MAEIVQFPRSKSRRIAARRPRRSKNGTPEERAAKKAAAQGNAEVVKLQRPITLAGIETAIKEAIEEGRRRIRAQRSTMPVRGEAAS